MGVATCGSGISRNMDLWEHGLVGVALVGTWTCGSGISRNMDLWEWH